MIDIKLGRYVPTLKTSYEHCLYKNIFRSEIHEIQTLDLTDAIKKSDEWLANHFGFVLLYHNGILLKRSCNYKLFENTFKRMNILISLENHIN